MGYEINLLQTLDKVIATENDQKITSFEEALRSNLSKTIGLTLKTTAFCISMIMSHYLVANNEVESIKVADNLLKDSPFLRSVLLVLALLGLLGMVVSDYMMRCYRETLDYLLIQMKSEFARTGLHDLTVPASFYMGLDLLANDSTFLGKTLANVLRTGINLLLISFPFVYLVNHFVHMAKNICDQLYFGLVAIISLVLLLIIIPLIIYKSSRLSNPKLVRNFYQNTK